MTLTLRLVLTLGVLIAVVFAAVGWAAVRVAGDTVERRLEERIDFTLRRIDENPGFFLIEATMGRQDYLRQVAGISGFEIVVPTADGWGVAASSLPAEAAAGLTGRGDVGDRFEATLGGVDYRGARGEVAGREVFLLVEADPIRTAKEAAQRRVLLASAAGLAAALLLGALLARTLTRPLRRLAAAASAVREGETEVALPAGGGREVGDLSRALREMLGRLARAREELVRREKMATLGRFSAAVAHELRNPLSSMRMTVQMLLSSAPEADREEYEFLLAEMARLDHSVDELLFHAGTPRYETAEADARDVVAETVRMVGPLAAHLEIELRAADAPEPVVLAGDAGKLRQALVNLVLNAVHAAGAGGAVDVAVGARDGEVVFSVRDSGPGVPEEIADRLFEPFVTGREGGTGLGLAVARAIARAHGGDVEHEPGPEGTVFRLRVRAEGA